jgi:hypothetical protein
VFLLNTGGYATTSLSKTPKGSAVSPIIQDILDFCRKKTKDGRYRFLIMVEKA